jgi:hypothetical protein
MTGALRSVSKEGIPTGARPPVPPFAHEPHSFVGACSIVLDRGLGIEHAPGDCECHWVAGQSNAVPCTRSRDRRRRRRGQPRCRCRGGPGRADRSGPPWCTWPRSVRSRWRGIREAGAEESGGRGRERPARRAWRRSLAQSRGTSAIRGLNPGPVPEIGTTCEDVAPEGSGGPSTDAGAEHDAEAEGGEDDAAAGGAGGSPPSVESGARADAAEEENAGEEGTPRRGPVGESGGCQCRLAEDHLASKVLHAPGPSSWVWAR